MPVLILNGLNECPAALAGELLEQVTRPDCASVRGHHHFDE